MTRYKFRSNRIKEIIQMLILMKTLNVFRFEIRQGRLLNKLILHKIF